MENKGFFKTKEGGLTIAFIVIIVAAIFIMAGLYNASDGLCMIGMLLIIGAMLYSPVRVFIFDKKK